EPVYLGPAGGSFFPDQSHPVMFFLRPSIRRCTARAADYLPVIGMNESQCVFRNQLFLRKAGYLRYLGIRINTRCIPGHYDAFIRILNQETVIPFARLETVEGPCLMYAYSDLLCDSHDN